jgi:hypothetical protein
MFTLVVFTLLIVCFLGAARYVAVKNKQVRASYFKVYEGSAPPEFLVRVGRNYTNLLEMTMLFYVACIAAIALNVNSETMIICAWGYVITRMVHSAYHIFVNVPIIRLMIFSVSCVFLLAQWIMLVQHVMANS